MVERVKINVIDLDKTLIPYDSFRVLIMKSISKFNFYVILQTLMRVLRITSMEKYKENITLHYIKTNKQEYFKSFAEVLFNDINVEVMEIITKETEVSTINILLSASPNLFVQYVVEQLKWVGTGSYFNDKNEFIHLYGENKINWLSANYSPDKFLYNFAISDSITDNELLTQFRKKIKWIA